MVSKYIPEQGDLIIVNFNPIKGHEQNGIRPAIVISSKTFNVFTNMAIVCPITSNNKIFPTHYKLNDSKKVHGCVMLEHIKSIDYSIRNIRFVEKSSDNDFLNCYLSLISCFDEKDKIRSIIN